MTSEEKLKKLGWERGELINNRLFFFIGVCVLFVHQADDKIGIFVNEEMIYHEPTDKQLELLTKGAKILQQMDEHPQDFTIKQKDDVEMALRCLIETIKKN